MNFLLSFFSLLAKIWRALPNRLVAAVVFFGGVGAIFWLYASFFVLDVGTVEFKVLGAYSSEVTLVGSFKTAGMYGSISGGTGAVCVGSCSFAKMPPVRYEWTASADGFAAATGSFDLPARSVFPVVVTLAPTVRYETYSPDAVRRAAEIRVRRDLDAYASGSVQTVGRRAVVRDPGAATLSGAQIWLPAAGGKALLKCDACDGGWAWWGAGRWAPLFPGQIPPAAVAAGALGVALLRAGDGSLQLVDVRSGTVVSLLGISDATAASAGSAANRYVLSRGFSSAVEYDASALAVARTFTGARNVAFLSDGSRVELAFAGRASLVSASGSVSLWPLPASATSAFSVGGDLVVRLEDGTYRVARNAAAQAQTLAK